MTIIDLLRQNNGSPPILRTWSRVYLAVLIYLFLLILSLYAFTEAFRY